VTAVRGHRLVPTGAHDSARLLAFVVAHAVPGVEAWDGRTWTSSAALPSGPAVVQVAVADGGGGTTAGFDVRLRLSSRGTDADRDEDTALQRLRHLLDLDADVAAAELVLCAGPRLAALVRRRPGLRVPGTLDAWETLVRTVIGQQISVVGARAVGARLVAAIGKPLPADLGGLVPGVTHVFPTPAAVQRLTAGHDALAMPGARAAAVIGAAEVFVAAAAAGGAVPVRESLLAVRGIGPWTADYLDLRARRDPDVFLPTDLAVRRAIERWGVDASPRALAELAEGWRPYRSTALMHLWADYLAL
jgi:AraC family transcriptional regulator, regulatory protein of adaptative response / DNA-3-methyladenine glycosylase II